MSTDHIQLVLAAKAAGMNYLTWGYPGDTFIASVPVEFRINNRQAWNPLRDDGDALRLAVKLRINVLFNDGFHHVGTNRHVVDICRCGGMAEIRREIVSIAAEIGKAMP